MQWAHALPPPAEKPRFGLLPSSRWPPASLLPSSVRRLSTRVIHGCRSFLRSHRCACSSIANLSPELKSELSRLQHSDSVITTADKGGKWTVLNRRLYINEAQRQLSDASLYRRTIDDNSHQVRSRISQLLLHLRSRNFISKRELLFLLPPSSFCERTFRLLPKLHKSVWCNSHMPPGRPIISDSGSISRNASNLVEYFLQPLCQRLASHLKDSGHLIALLRNATVSPCSILFTFDVAALYTNVPIDEGLDCVSRAFLQYPDQTRPDATVLSILRLLLNSNSFTFEGEHWLQLHGVAMGKTFGGSFANLFLGVWENQALSSFSVRPSMWVRFQDDIFGIWDHGESSLLRFHEHLNAQHPRISLTLHHGRTVNFLDLTITARENCLSYSLFAKDTDTHFILPRDSHHPPHTFKGILFGELLRFATHSSSRESFNRTVSVVTPVWRALGYTRALIRTTKREVLARSAQTTSWPTGMFACKDSRCSVCCFVQCTNAFNHPSTNVSYPITCRITCDTENTIYLIRCKKCGLTYVGQTHQPLRTRILQHLRNIRQCLNLTPLQRHFRDFCGPESFSFLGIEILPNDARRLHKETKWIDSLETRVPRGLNVTRTRASTSNLILPFSSCSTRVTSAIRRWCGRHVNFRICHSRARNLAELLSRRRPRNES